MRMLSEDDLDVVVMDDTELEAAWDLWFDLAQTTNDDDPPFTHGVLVNVSREQLGGEPRQAEGSATSRRRGREDLHGR